MNTQDYSASLPQIAQAKRDGTFNAKRSAFNIKNANAKIRQVMDEAGKIHYLNEDEWSKFATAFAKQDSKFDPVLGYSGKSEKASGPAQGYMPSNAGTIGSNAGTIGSSSEGPVAGGGARKSGGIDSRSIGNLAGAIGTLDQRGLDALSRGLGGAGGDPLRMGLEELAGYEARRKLSNPLSDESIKRGMAARDPQLLPWQRSAIPGYYDVGGYTGDGGKYQPAGIVHAGEYVLSQEDVARAGGPRKLDQIFGRQSKVPAGGYARGGLVDYTQQMRDEMAAQDARDATVRTKVYKAPDGRDRMPGYARGGLVDPLMEGFDEEAVRADAYDAFMGTAKSAKSIMGNTYDPVSNSLIRDNPGQRNEWYRSMKEKYGVQLNDGDMMSGNATNWVNSVAGIARDKHRNRMQNIKPQAMPSWRAPQPVSPIPSLNSYADGGEVGEITTQDAQNFINQFITNGRQLEKLRSSQQVPILEKLAVIMKLPNRVDLVSQLMADNHAIRGGGAAGFMTEFMNSIGRADAANKLLDSDKNQVRQRVIATQAINRANQLAGEASQIEGTLNANIAHAAQKTANDLVINSLKKKESGLGDEMSMDEALSIAYSMLHDDGNMRPEDKSKIQTIAYKRQQATQARAYAMDLGRKGVIPYSSPTEQAEESDFTNPYVEPVKRSLAPDVAGILGHNGSLRGLRYIDKEGKEAYTGVTAVGPNINISAPSVFPNGSVGTLQKAGLYTVTNKNGEVRPFASEQDAIKAYQSEAAAVSAPTRPRGVEGDYGKSFERVLAGQPKLDDYRADAATAETTPAPAVVRALPAASYGGSFSQIMAGQPKLSDYLADPQDDLYAGSSLDYWDPANYDYSPESAQKSAQKSAPVSEYPYIPSGLPDWMLPERGLHDSYADAAVNILKSATEGVAQGGLALRDYLNTLDMDNAANVNRGAAYKGAYAPEYVFGRRKL